MDNIIKEDDKTNSSVNKLLEIVDKSDWFNSIKSQKIKKEAKEQIAHLLRSAYSNGRYTALEEAVDILGVVAKKRKRNKKEVNKNEG